MEDYKKPFTLKDKLKKSVGMKVRQKYEQIPLLSEEEIREKYKQKKAEKAKKRKQIVKNLQKKMNNNSNPLFGGYMQPSQPQSPQQSKRPKKRMNPLFGGTYQMPSSDLFFGPKPMPQVYNHATSEDVEKRLIEINAMLKSI